eukprot:3150885-Prymnesium_polylepis.1
MSGRTATWSWRQSVHSTFGAAIAERLGANLTNLSAQPQRPELELVPTKVKSQNSKDYGLQGM